MALNISFDGYSYDSTNTLGNSNIHYQALFYPSTTASSPSKWGPVQLIEASGYYSCNLGDALWLSQEGTALTGAKVIIVFWRGAADRNADCSLVTQWGATEITLTSASFYTNNVQIKTNILPTLNWSHNIPVHGYTNTNYSITNNSDDEHSWDFNGVIMHHWYSRFGHVINANNIIDSTDYEWGNGESELDVFGTTNTSYQWSTAGAYDITITIRDACGDEVAEVEPVNIYRHAPVLNITRCTEAGATQGNTVYPPDTKVFFKYAGTDIDSAITSIEWRVNDAIDTVITKNDSTSIVAHTEGEGTSWIAHAATPGAFTDPGTHVVEIMVNWYDGYESQTVSYSENFSQLTYSTAPSANLICNEATANNVAIPSTIVTFDYTGSNPDDRIIGIDWTINDDTDTVVTNVSYDTTVYHTEGVGGSWFGNLATIGAFSTYGIHSIDVKVHWNDGWDDKEVNYSENITQGVFSGPTLSMDQVPPKAVMASGVTFVNTSINTDRVGLGQYQQDEYEWVWTDKTLTETESDKPYEYQFTKVPTTTECVVYLYAEWSDGFVQQTSWIDEPVIFDTTVIVTPEDCYYNINVIGTSSDGSATSYNWTVSSGISETGPWDVVWESPTGIDQQQKTLCFSATSWYKVTGYVNGTGASTSDYETLLITEVCPDSVAVYNIWNGTGILDLDLDWDRSGAGVETEVSRYRGTNGLDVVYSKTEDEILFTRSIDSDINDYDFLSFWINIRKWNTKKDIYIKLFSSNYTYGQKIGLSSYVSTSNIKTWTRVMIPISRFNLKAQFAELGWPTLINSLIFQLKGDIDFWLDNVALSMGSLITVPVCPPDMEAADIGDLTMTAQDIGQVPMVAVTSPGIVPITPNISVISPFPKPINI